MNKGVPKKIKRWWCKYPLWCEGQKKRGLLGTRCRWHDCDYLNKRSIFALSRHR